MPDGAPIATRVFASFAPSGPRRIPRFRADFIALPGSSASRNRCKRAVSPSGWAVTRRRPFAGRRVWGTAGNQSCSVRRPTCRRRSCARKSPPCANWPRLADATRRQSPSPSAPLSSSPRAGGRASSAAVRSVSLRGCAAIKPWAYRIFASISRVYRLTACCGPWNALLQKCDRKSCDRGGSYDHHRCYSHPPDRGDGDHRRRRAHPGARRRPLPLLRGEVPEYRENKPLFTCPTRQHLLAPRPCPHGACLSAAPACQCWLLVRPPGWPPASRAAHHAGSKLRPAAAKTGANGWELLQWGWHEVTVDNALAHAEACCGKPGQKRLCWLTQKRPGWPPCIRQWKVRESVAVV